MPFAFLLLLREEIVEENKLFWNVMPYCTDPVLEDVIHELGNIHGYLFVNGNHKNYRYLMLIYLLSILPFTYHIINFDPASLKSGTRE